MFATFRMLQGILLSYTPFTLYYSLTLSLTGMQFVSLCQSIIAIAVNWRHDLHRNNNTKAEAVPQNPK